MVTVESEPKPSPCFQDFTDTILKPGAARVTVVSPLTSLQYAGETTDTREPRVSAALWTITGVAPQAGAIRQRGAIMARIATGHFIVIGIMQFGLEGCCLSNSKDVGFL